ncbi:S-formylglutathione hydrolase FrmB [Actinomadura meyerae]|uniref:S-formylglutathione hydrolase FrmB n=1 Tax=Actinomadura meyerae TaxID=240840 RepID=A0A239HS36_9ACTN|nr:alpha/beta hydrolase family protein [Actinomadura meyerae]SNS84116.1 S-formylglutathione hydrolase FrmB [Actinomadura meyerae]
MKKRTDRKIAIAGTAAAAVLLPTVMVGLAQAGIGVPTGKSEASGDSRPIPSFGPPTQQAPVVGASPSKSPKAAKLPSVPLNSNPFKTGGGRPSAGDPDTDRRSHGEKPKLPSGAGASKYAKAPDGAAITEVKKVNARQFDVTIASPALGAAVKTRVMVPKGWKRTASRTWPTVYAYHGGNNTYLSWTRDSNIEEVAGPYDAMVVMPEGGWNGSYTNWWNGGKGGIPEWETFHIQEVIPLMERNFRAGTTRAAIGLSSGGQGAITYAERHTGMFKYAAAYSGALNITAPGMPVILTSMNREAGTSIWGDPVIARANWRAHDATVNVAKLKGIGVYVSCGDGRPGPLDNPNTPPHDAGRIGEQLAGTMNENFVAAAKSAGVPVTANLYGPGMHNWKYWKRELVKSWPGIAAAIGARKS